jgi:4-hydroxy-tetrahydrodipicolinate synthase
MEGTVALKLGLKARGVLPSATVRSPLRDLSAAAEQEIVRALESAELV